MVSSPKQTQPLLPLGLLLVTEALAGWFRGTKCPQHGCGHRPTCPHSGEDWDAEHPHTHRLPELPHIEAGFPGGHSRPPHFRLFRPRQRMAQQHFCYVLLVTARQRISAVGEGYLSWEGATSSAQSRGTAGSRVCTFITAPALDGGIPVTLPGAMLTRPGLGRARGTQFPHPAPVTIYDSHKNELYESGHKCTGTGK